LSAATALAPFRTRSFRFLWPADLCTAWAMEMETLILGWYVLVETGSVVLLTLFGSLMYVGTLVSPVVGMLGDRLGLGRVLGALRLAYAFFAGVILLSAFSGQLSPTLVLVVAALAGVVRPSDIGMRSALISATLPAQHLVAALSVSRTTQDSARICGALAGAGFMAAFGMVPAYVVITALYVGAALMTLYAAARGPEVPPATPVPARPPRLSPWREVKEGLAHVWHTPRLRAAMSLAALVNLNAFPLTMGLMPYTAREVFQLDQRGLGWLVASFACGALIGSLALSAWGRPGGAGHAAAGRRCAEPEHGDAVHHPAAHDRRAFSRPHHGGAHAGHLHPAAGLDGRGRAHPALGLPAHGPDVRADGPGADAGDCGRLAR